MKDVQNQKDTRNIPIQKIGVKDVEIPLTIQKKPKNPEDKPEFITVYSKAKMSVGLPAQYKGTHMSRFIEILNEYKSEMLADDMEKILFEMKKRLDAECAYIKLDFKYFIERFAPVSALKSAMCYDCAFVGEVRDDCNFKFNLIAKVPVTTLCPCSKEISDFGAHNQRAIVKVTVGYDSSNIIWLEDLIELVESCGSAKVYPLLKREDEKFVTETAYNNPKFVEDVLRDVVLKLKKIDIIKSYTVEVEAFESIHNHNAWGLQKYDGN